MILMMKTVMKLELRSLKIFWKLWERISPVTLVVMMITYIIEFLKLTLGSKPCQNQGYILDGYPKTFKQARELFGHFGVSQLQDSSEGQYLDLQSNIIPGYIFLLESTEDFLRNRIISLPQILIEGISFASSFSS